MAQSKEKIYAFDLWGEFIREGKNTIKPFGTYTLKIVTTEFPSTLMLLNAIKNKEIEELNCIFDNGRDYCIKYGDKSKLPSLFIKYYGTYTYFYINNIRKI